MNAAPDLGTGAMLAETLRVVLILGGVLALAVAVLRYVLPRLVHGRAQAEGPFKMIARFPLEPRKTLYMVEARGQVLLLGTSERDIHYLATLPRAAADPESEPKPVVRFRA
ncbi:MAG: flagellar biosynthetic protein FliO [Bryobacteraceae bacterium]